MTAFSGHRKHEGIDDLLTAQNICGLVTCTEMNSKDSCGTRLPMSQAQHRYNFKKLEIVTILPITNMKIMPDTLTQELLPLETSEFVYQM